MSADLPPVMYECVQHGLARVQQGPFVSYVTEADLLAHLAHLENPEHPGTVVLHGGQVWDESQVRAILGVLDTPIPTVCHKGGDAHDEPCRHSVQHDDEPDMEGPLA